MPTDIEELFLLEDLEQSNHSSEIELPVSNKSFIPKKAKLRCIICLLTIICILILISVITIANNNKNTYATDEKQRNNSANQNHSQINIFVTTTISPSTIKSTTVTDTHLTENKNNHFSTESTNNDSRISSTESINNDSRISSTESINNDSRISSTESINNDSRISSTESTKGDSSISTSSTESTKGDSSISTSSTESTKGDSSISSTESTKAVSSISSTESTKNDSSISSTESTKGDSSIFSTESTKRNSSISSTESTKGDSSISSTESTKVKKCTKDSCKEAASELKSFMNESYDPCTNFYEYSCGGWITQHPVPKEFITSYDMFDQMNLDNSKTIQEILDGLKADPTKYIYLGSHSAERKAYDFYVSCRQAPLYYYYGTGEKLSSKCAMETASFFPDVMSRLFVLQKFRQEKANDTLKMFEETKEVYENIVTNLNWIDDDNKQRILDQFKQLSLINGYPPSLLDKEAIERRYKYVPIRSNSYFSNLRTLRLISKPDYDYVRIANAEFFRIENQVKLHAGICQKPFYQSSYPKIINSARLGSIIGHELSHAFQHYLNGTSGESFNNYTDRITCMEKQYNGLAINREYLYSGVTAFKENFADIGGLQVAYKTYFENYRKHFEVLPGLENFTPSQIFFIAAAQHRCKTYLPGKQSDEMHRVLNQGYSPASLRVLGPMTNSRHFGEAFNCPFNELYNKKHKCEIF